MARMKIFNTLEEEAFESPPEFNSGERKRFFSLSLLLKESQANLRTPTNKVCFLVAAGYFKALRKFFARQFRIDGGLYGAQQRVDQSVVEFEGLIDDERDKMQKAVFVGATRDLRDLGLDH